MKHSQQFPVVHLRLLAFLPLVALLTGACDVSEPLRPPPTPSNDVVAASDKAFYLHQEEPVYLLPSYEKITVALKESSAPTAVEDLLSSLRLSVADSRRFYRGQSHRILTLEGNLENGPAAIAALRADARVEFAAPSYTLEEGLDTLRLLNELVVHFRSKATRESIDSLITALDARIVRWPQPEYGWDEYRLAYPPGVDPLVFAAQLQAHPLVEWTDPNKIGTIDPRLESPNDPYYSLQYYFRNASNGIDDNIEPAWDVTLGGGAPSAGGLRVAVLDDGVQASHPDFGNQVKSYYAWDAVNGNHALAADPQCSDDSHGTFVTGLILGQHDNGEGIAGGAPGAYVIPIRIYSNCDAPYRASDADLANAISWAWYWTGSDVLSNSWRWPHLSTAVTNEINEAVANGRAGKGATVVFAAGNTSRRYLADYRGMTYPGYLSAVIGVGAIDRDGDPADYTPRDSRLDIVALSSPFTGGCGIGDVRTTELTGRNRACDDGPNGDVDYTSTFSGTSAAAPQVAAAAALLYSVDLNRTESTVRSMLLDNADYWGRSDDFGAGKLNVGNAISVKASIEGPTEVYSYKECTWHANATGGNPPYSFAWYRDGLQVDNDATYTGNTGTADFLLEVLVTDQSPLPAVRDAINVSVIQNPMALSCEPT